MSLLRPRRDFDPRLTARRYARIVGAGTGAVVPVRLWRSRALAVHPRPPHDHGRGWVAVVGGVAVVGRVIPPVRVPQEWGAHHDDAMAPDPAMTDPVAPVPLVPAAVPAVPAAAPCIAWHCSN